MSRYIDEEEAKKAWYIELGITSKRAAIGVDLVFERIPTADVAPVRHAHWIYEQYFGDYSLHVFKCSVCDRKISVNKKEEIVDFPYCNCGAKMDERIKENGTVH